MTTGLPLALVALLGSAHAAGDPRTMDSLGDAQLVMALDGTPKVAAQYLEETLEELPPEDPLHGEALYWLARARLEEGRTEDALTLLREVGGDPLAGPRARLLLAHLDLSSHQFARLPVTCTFDRDTCGLVRSAEVAVGGNKPANPAVGGGRTQPRSTLEIIDFGDDSALAWDTTVETTESDRIALALAPGLQLREMSVRVRASQFAAQIRITASDGSGGRWSTAMIRVPTEEWIEVDFPLSAFSAVNPAPQSREPRAVRVVEIEDLSGKLGSERGENTLLLDDLVLK